MAGIITTGTVPQALKVGIHAFWRSYAKRPALWRALFDEQMSSWQWEEVVQLTGFGIAPVKIQGRAADLDDEQQGYSTRYVHVVYGKRYTCTEEEQMFNLYPLVKNRTEALMFAIQQTEEIVAADFLNNGFNTAFPIGDGAALFSLAHPNVSGNQANTPTVPAPLSEASLEDECIAVMNIKNARGLFVNVTPQSLHVAPANLPKAHRILNSTLQSGTANNDENWIRQSSMFPKGVFANPFLNANPNAYYIKTDAPQGLTRFTARKPRVQTSNDTLTGNMQVTADVFFSLGVSDWRAVRGVNAP